MSRSTQRGIISISSETSAESGDSQLKTTAMMVKIKRGKAEKPPMPSLDSPANGVSQVSESESEESLMKRLIAKGINGDMDEINNLDNKVLRGKIKAAIVKEKRVKK